jgi:hypothetical protein
MSDTQFFADQMEQMDLALDQLVLKDRNFDRFALMLVDNVVELTLHRYAEGQNNRYSPPKGIDPVVLSAALGQRFDAKLKLAKLNGLLSDELARSFGFLHSFRNTAHHRGLRHERILRALSLFYFEGACASLCEWKSSWSSHSDDAIPHRALKYLGRRGAAAPERFRAAWQRLAEVATSMGDTLVHDLAEDMKKTIDSADEAIEFVATDSPEPKTRAGVIIDAQTWAFWRTDEAKAYAAAKRPASAKQTVGASVDWLAANYPWPIKVDPIPSWRKRLKSLAGESNRHLALKKYCEFMAQTEDLRGLIHQSASGLDAHIQQQIDEARGK